MTGCINNQQPVVTENYDIAEKCVNKEKNVNSESMYIDKQSCFDHTLRLCDTALFYFYCVS